MTRSHVVLLLAFCGALALVGWAASPSAPLHGTLSIRGATIIDPPPGEPANTHAAFVIEGDAARLLYDTLDVTPSDDVCDGRGGSIKRSGNLTCYRNADGSSYECDFAIDLAKGRIENGRVC